MTSPLAWLGVILLAWTAACTWLWALYLREECHGRRRARDEAATERTRREARDEAAEAASAQLAARVDEEYRVLCEREGGGRG